MQSAPELQAPCLGRIGTQQKAGVVAPAFYFVAGAGPAAFKDQLRWLLMSLVISNIDTWAFLKISFSLASALIIVRLAES